MAPTTNDHLSRVCLLDKTGPIGSLRRRQRARQVARQGRLRPTRPDFHLGPALCARDDVGFPHTSARPHRLGHLQHAVTQELGRLRGAAAADRDEDRLMAVARVGDHQHRDVRADRQGTGEALGFLREKIAEEFEGLGVAGSGALIQGDSFAQGEAGVGGGHVSLRGPPAATPDKESSDERGAAAPHVTARTAGRLPGSA
jgi:hypothetical protein